MAPAKPLPNPDRSGIDRVQVAIPARGEDVARGLHLRNPFVNRVELVDVGP